MAALRELRGAWRTLSRHTLRALKIPRVGEYGSTRLGPLPGGETEVVALGLELGELPDGLLDGLPD
ncbi:hypothetical protein [Nocardioides mangrovicus]|uniref:hypothetical protein n=1 Tax=Nocardioides mangrovicus TaxID=2478913 RepID=UPI0011C3A3D8|nr:hypothetical protein [Nocardioides mangrovicus]